MNMCSCRPRYMRTYVRYVSSPVSDRSSEKIGDKPIEFRIQRIITDNLFVRDGCEEENVKHPSENDR